MKSVNVGGSDRIRFYLAVFFRIEVVRTKLWHAGGLAETRRHWQ